MEGGQSICPLGSCQTRSAGWVKAQIVGVRRRRGKGRGTKDKTKARRGEAKAQLPGAGLERKGINARQKEAEAQLPAAWYTKGSAGRGRSTAPSGIRKMLVYTWVLPYYLLWESPMGRGKGSASRSIAHKIRAQQGGAKVRLPEAYRG